MTPFYEVCVCYITRQTESGASQVLLGRKKTGLGTGNIVGPGGKLEPGESAVEAMVREIEEESGLIVDPVDLTRVGYIRYEFPHRESWNQHSTVFVTERFAGTARETDEIASAWYDVHDLPLDGMWDDAKYWLPGVLAGKTIHARFTFGEDLRTVSDSDFEAV